MSSFALRMALLVFLVLAGTVGTMPAQERVTVRAVLAAEPPVLDGRDDDAIWQRISPVDGFREMRPVEDGEPTQRTAFRVAYDPEYLYVFIRAHDTHPDSILGRLSRRDNITASDQMMVLIDPYRDRRNGFEFAVNPVGVRYDAAVYNDGDEDSAWDGVWDVATSVDSLGWSAEFRIPFSQLRFSPADELSFGFGLWRRVERHTAESTWPLIRRSRPGLISQFGDLAGLAGVAAPKRSEIIPYAVAQTEPVPGRITDQRQRVTIGGDLRHAIASNILLDATINPDFGQVEADPGQLNLSAFETFQREQRPFFVSGSGLFDYRINCFAVVDCSTGEQLFYSRRIGRAPELAGRLGDASTPASTRILGAAKVAGRTTGGLAFGLLDAVSDRVGGPGDRTVEPRTNHAVLRATQDFAGGRSAIGAMVTAVHRDLDGGTEPFLHRSAWTGGIDARHRLGRFDLSGSLMASRVAGTAEAISLTQRRPAHYYQRPDGNLEFDPSRTSLAGHSMEMRFAKVGGELTRFETGYGYRSAGFELNDIGFLRQAGQHTWTNWFAFNYRTPTRIYRELRWNLNWWQYWTLDGLTTDRAFNTNVHAQLHNRWWVHAGGTRQLGTRYCDRNCTRGGPALRVEPSFSPWMGIEGDDRKVLVPAVWVQYNSASGGRSDRLGIEPSLRVKVASQFSTTVGLDWSRNRDDAQWFGNVTDPDGTMHYTFAALDQETLGLTWRLDYTMTPTASFQFYANPFISKGSYSRVRELADSRADRYEDRFQPWSGQSSVDPGGFNVQQLRSNAVFRWEYRPGSTLFLVWSHGRSHSDDIAGDRSFGGDLGNLFDQPAENRFLVKISYWLNR